MIDVDHQTSSVRRDVGSRVLEAGEARVMTISRAYDTDVADLWDACTSIERIPRWFLPVTGDLRPGGRYQLQGNASGTVQSCDPPHGFTATWEFGSQVSWIDVRVEPEPGGGARVTLEHVAHVDDERWAEYGPGAMGVGWDLGVVGLGLHLSSGETVDPQQVEAWTVSQEGRRFVRRCSEAWAAASVHAGTPAAAADEAAARTTAFYTGVDPDEPTG